MCSDGSPLLAGRGHQVRFLDDREDEETSKTSPHGISSEPHLPCLPRKDGLIRSSERLSSTLNEAPSRGATPCRSLQTVNVTPTSKRYTESLLRYVSTETVAELVRSDKVSEEDAIYLVDCRYPYEFKGGHIVNAMNFPPYDMESLKEFVFNELASRDRRRAIIILHCEFSQVRAPLATDALKKHSARYGCSRPLELYVMKGGYCDFFRKFKQLCEPQAYTEMQGNSAENVDIGLNLLYPDSRQLSRSSPPPALVARGRRRKARGRCFDDMEISFRDSRRRRSSRLSSSSWGTMDERESPIRLLSDDLIWHVRPSIHSKDNTAAGWGSSEDTCSNTASTATAFTSAGLESGTRRSSVSSVSMLDSCVSDADEVV